MHVRCREQIEGQLQNAFAAELLVAQPPHWQPEGKRKGQPQHLQPGRNNVEAVPVNLQNSLPPDTAAAESLAGLIKLLERYWGGKSFKIVSCKMIKELGTDKILMLGSARG